MPLKMESRHLDEIVVLVPQVFEDERGYFMETFRADSFKDWGLPQAFVQENHSYSRKGVLRGLHFQWDPPKGEIDACNSRRCFSCRCGCTTWVANGGEMVRN